MLTSPLVLAVGGAYLALLFVIAFVTDRLAAAGRVNALFTPVVYTLSLAVYCTSWTFFGAVGTAVRSGLEFVTIYIGPTLVLMAWWLFLPKLVRVAKAQRITSIADFLSARYGKSRPVAVIVTLIAIASITPYIALQLLAITRSFTALVGEGEATADTGFWVAVAMIFFVCLFGTRRLNADESQPGIVAAIAFESVVKLGALLAISVFAFLLVRGGPAEGGAFADWREALHAVGTMPDERGVRWVVLTTLSAIAIICLPRQFQVTVIENRDESHLGVAAWLFPLYLFLITLGVLPIAVAGLTHLPPGNEPDLFVLTVPLAEGAHALAVVAFIGGLSAATSMVIVASLALAVMISNHLVAPELAERPSRDATGLTAAVLFTRRVAIVLILALAYLYSRASGAENGLASIGLIAFAGVAQFAPALFGGLFWRNANRIGATIGLLAGAAVWVVTLLLPSFGFAEGVAAVLRTTVLPPRMAAGPEAVDPLVFGVLLSLTLNTVLYVLGSLLTRGAAIDQLQATLFVDALHRGGPEPTLRRSVNRRDLFRLTQRILGPERAHAMFAGDGGGNELVDSAFLAHVEREIGYALGAASAHTMVTRVATGEPISVDAAISLLRETQDAIEAARQLGVRSVELERTASELRTANATLTELLLEKDDFLSRVSHEMRTPLTAIRAFAELLRDGPDDADRAARFIEIIFTESERLTRLLDDILDLSRLEAGIAPIDTRRIDAAEIARQSAAAMEGFAERNRVELRIDAPGPVWVHADADRLKQVLVNLISNAVKFHGSVPHVRITAGAEEGHAVLRVRDHGGGVAESLRPRLFTKFGGTWSGGNSRSGAGLGLAISRQIMVRLGGDLKLEHTGRDGSVFAALLPLDRSAA
ncbi:sensor histidine kinase [Acuticoccus kandeliae]|uniref:sensor histidine kinase n=1 Tax=Acuticoccus kandeliae TaxID=2073160 RepID=UPI000D3E355D|nr:sensor histidine kinase [Acuticoccus kandeliae]